MQLSVFNYVTCGICFHNSLVGFCPFIQSELVLAESGLLSDFLAHNFLPMLTFSFSFSFFFVIKLGFSDGHSNTLTLFPVSNLVLGNP